MTVEGPPHAEQINGGDPRLGEVQSPGGTTTIVLVYDVELGLTLCTLIDGVEVVRVVDVGLHTASGRLRTERPADVVELSLCDWADSFRLPTGKSVRSELQATLGTFAVAADDQHRLLLDVLVSDHGAAHRLRLEALATDTESSSVEILDESARFCLANGTRTWIQDHDRVGRVTPAYEGWYSNGTVIEDLAPSESGWTMPALFETKGHWVLLAEAAADGVTGGSHLNVTAESALTLRRPHHDEGDPAHGSTVNGNLPILMPWRVMLVGQLDDIFESNMIRHLCPKASTEIDYSWIHPGRVAWTWWSDHDSPRNPVALRAAVDSAAALGWEYLLIDANWNHLPWGSIEDLVGYATSRSVDVMLWYNSGGPNNQMDEEPRNLMTEPAVRQAELARVADLGVKGIKVDFFHSDKPEGIAQFEGILDDAAEVGLLVNFHGCTAPRGWSRTHPHLMTTEAVRGSEWYRLSSDYGPRAPVNNTILPFTRNVVGSMDYTPVVLSDLAQGRVTTNCHELALAVIFESGLLHFCDDPEQYLLQPEPVTRFLRSVPVAWDETRLLEGEPGSHVALARRSGHTWFVAAINGCPTDIDVRFDLVQLGVNPKQPLELVTDSGKPEAPFGHTRTTALEMSEGPLPLMPYGGLVAWTPPA